MSSYEDVDVLVPYRASEAYHRERNAEFIIKHLGNVLPGSLVTVCDDDDPDLFNRGRAVNAGVEASERPIMVIADGDVWLPPAPLREAVAILRRTSAVQRSYVVPFDKVVWMDEEWSRRVLDGLTPIASRPPARHVILEWGQCSVGICNVVLRERFLDLGGFDPRFRGWGCEDCAWDAAAETLFGPKVRLHAEGRHLFHPACSSKEDPARMERTAELYLRYSSAKGDRAAMLSLLREAAPCAS